MQDEANLVDFDKLNNRDKEENSEDKDLNNKEEEFKNKTDKIRNPEILKLKEKLLAKKRKKIDQLYENIDEDEILENKLEKDIEIDEDDEFGLTQKIRRLENYEEPETDKDKNRKKNLLFNKNDTSGLITSRNKKQKHK